MANTRQGTRWDPRRHANGPSPRNRAADGGLSIEIWENEGGALLDDQRDVRGKAYESNRSAGVARVPIAIVS